MELSNDARKCRIGSLFHYFRFFKPLTFAERWTTLDSNEDKMFMHRSHLQFGGGLNFNTLDTYLQAEFSFHQGPIFYPFCQAVHYRVYQQVLDLI